MTIEVRLVREQYRSAINGRTYIRTRASFPEDVWKIEGGSFRREGDRLVLIPRRK